MQPVVVGIGVLAFAVCGKRRWMCLVSLRRLIEPAPINSAFQPEDIEGHHLVYVPLEDLRMPAREIRKLDPAHVLDVANAISTLGFCARGVAGFLLGQSRDKRVPGSGEGGASPEVAG
jgi:hypothetical protein